MPFSSTSFSEIFQGIIDQINEHFIDFEAEDDRFSCNTDAELFSHLVDGLCDDQFGEILPLLAEMKSHMSENDRLEALQFIKGNGSYYQIVSLVEHDQLAALQFLIGEFTPASMRDNICQKILEKARNPIIDLVTSLSEFKGESYHYIARSLQDRQQQNEAIKDIVVVALRRLGLSGDLVSGAMEMMNFFDLSQESDNASFRESFDSIVTRIQSEGNFRNVMDVASFLNHTIPKNNINQHHYDRLSLVVISNYLDDPRGLDYLESQLGKNGNFSNVLAIVKECATLLQNQPQEVSEYVSIRPIIDVLIDGTTLEDTRHYLQQNTNRVESFSKREIFSQRKENFPEGLLKLEDTQIRILLGAISKTSHANQGAGAGVITQNTTPPNLSGTKRTIDGEPSSIIKAKETVKQLDEALNFLRK